MPLPRSGCRPEVIKALAANGRRWLTESGTGAFYVKMNTTKPPLDDVNCRMAFAKAFDYGAAIKMIAVTDTVSQGAASTGAVPVGMFGANPADQVLTRDLEAARQHLAECKYKPEDFALEISWIAEVPVEERFALLMQANYAELGVKSEIEAALGTVRGTGKHTRKHPAYQPDLRQRGHRRSRHAALWHVPFVRAWNMAVAANISTTPKWTSNSRQAGPPPRRRDAEEPMPAECPADGIAPTIYGCDRAVGVRSHCPCQVPGLVRPSKRLRSGRNGFHLPADGSR